MNPKGHVCNAVHVGDRVKFHFGHGSMNQKPGWPEDQGVVTEIVRRYGKRHGSNDLILFNSEAQGESRPADASYIVEILEIGKGPRWRWRNSVGLNAERQKAMSNICATEKKGEWFGDFQSLVMQVLFTCHHLVLQSRLDFKKAHKLWLKTRVGVKQPARQYRDSNFFRGCYLVKVKPFKRWVMQNINRFLETADNCDRYDDEDNDENQRMFYEDLDSFSDEMDRQLDARLNRDPELNAAMHLGSDYDDASLEAGRRAVEDEGSCYDEATIEVPLRAVEKKVAEDLGLKKPSPVVTFSYVMDPDPFLTPERLEEWRNLVINPNLSAEKAEQTGEVTMTLTEEKDPTGKAIKEHLDGWVGEIKGQ